MTDTNQLPPMPEPEGVIVVGTQALRGFTADQMRAYALQARAQVQGEPPIGAIGRVMNWAMEQAVANGANSVSMPDEIVEIAAWLAGIPPQPAQAAQAEVTDEFLYELWEQKYRSWIGGEQFEQIARVILALRPERVPMTDEQRQSAFLSAPTSRGGHRTAFMLGIQFAEAHHDIKPKEQA